MSHTDALKLEWKTIAFGGSWDIMSSKDDIVAIDIPHGAVADHIVKLHNQSLARANANVPITKKTDGPKVPTPRPPAKKTGDATA